MLQPLSQKEKSVLTYIESFLNKEGISPSYQEIKDHFGFASYNSVQRYLQQLQRKNYIHVPGGNQKRAIVLLQASDSLKNHLLSLKSPPPTSSRKEASAIEPKSLSVPLLGSVAAGQPIEAYEHNEFLNVSNCLIRQHEKTFALKVQGSSMIEDGIFDGDFILVQQQETANNSEIVVATVENEATVKRFYLHKNTEKSIELRPANSNMKPMWYEPHEVSIRGVVVGLIRKF